MTTSEALAWVSFAHTVGMLALTIGCPVAGVTTVVTMIALKQGGKIALQKAIACGLISGVAATAFAYMAMKSGDNGDGGSEPITVPPGVQQGMLDQEVMQLTIEADADGRGRVRLGDELVPGEQVVEALLHYATQGNLRRVEYKIDLPVEEHGEWRLFMMEVESSLETARPSLEMVTVTGEVQK
jgi:hypothetical protein